MNSLSAAELLADYEDLLGAIESMDPEFGCGADGNLLAGRPSIFAQIRWSCRDTINCFKHFLKIPVKHTDKIIVNKFALIFATLTRLLAQPCSGNGQELADRVYFVVCYDATLKVPVWTAHQIGREQLHGGSARPHVFQHDIALSGPHARNSDYRHSGYSRGHMVPAEDMAWSDAAIQSTFLLSNAVPQRQSVNAGMWRRLETAVREIAAAADVAYVFTGPIFGNQIERIGVGAVAVPTHTFKIVLAVTGERKTFYAAIVPNGSTGNKPLSEFTATVEEVECRTGLEFFTGATAIPELPGQ